MLDGLAGDPVEAIPREAASGTVRGARALRGPRPWRSRLTREAYGDLRPEAGRNPRSRHGPRWWPTGCPDGYGRGVSPLRRCSRTACGRPAVATLTYAYSDSTAVVGPLATYAEPHSYDLCDAHADRLTAPRGWEVVRLDVDAELAMPGEDDLAALAEAVREAARPAPVAVPALSEPDGHGRRGHLRVIPPTT